MSTVDDAGIVSPAGPTRDHPARPAATTAGGIHDDSRLRRTVDVLIATVALFAFSPLFVLLGLAVLLDSPGPMIFKQVRVGRGGRPFKIVKFRSMVPDAARTGAPVSGRRDPRVTRVGRLLRATKLDELPQLINMLRGDMTMIGPRAEVPEYVEHYTAEEAELLAVRPGLTGAGQLHFTVEQADELDAVDDPAAHYLAHQLHPKLALDLAYLRDRRLTADCRLLWATAVCLLGVRRRRDEPSETGGG